jgi:hypothetical protein
MYKRLIIISVVIMSLFFAVVALADPNVPSIKQELLPLNPNLKFPTLSAYETEIKKPGIVLDSNFVCLFAPKEKTREAKIIFRYLVKAYDELYQIVGRHTEYKIVVYHFPENNPNFKGGTSNCTLWYGYKNLDLNSFEEWKKYHTPHISGYIEEMAHNFVSGTHAQFGWEMIGWSISVKVANSMAANPVLNKSIQDTRRQQEETFNRYVQAGCVFPSDIEANLCDRIHAYLLWKCERKYGPNFWRDFFREINKEYKPLVEAVKLGDSDQIRNKRYRITIDCFDRLEGLNFKEMLRHYQISLTTDVKSLHPTDAGWNRRFISDSEIGLLKQRP